MSIEGLIASAGHVVSIQRQTGTSRRPDGTIDRSNWQPVQAGLVAWVQPAPAKVILQYSQRNVRVVHRVFLREDPNVQEGDRLEYNGKYYTIQESKNVVGLNRLWILDVG